MLHIQDQNVSNLPSIYDNFDQRATLIRLERSDEEGRDRRTKPWIDSVDRFDLLERNVTDLAGTAAAGFEATASLDHFMALGARPVPS